jgi:DUF4097 and DUF4098 domain-containing protein YvlB
MGIDPVTDMGSQPKLSTVFVLMVTFWSLFLTAQENRESRYSVDRHAIVSITNDYGSIKVGPSADRQVVVTTVTRSGTPIFVSEQHGSRIELRSVLTRQAVGVVDYIVQVPDDSVVRLQSSDGNIHVEGLGGDLIMETLTASVDVTNITHAHLHLRTLSGPIKLSAVRNSHIDVHSLKGDVSLRDVTSSSVKVDSGNGQTKYAGDPGLGGEYLLTSMSGNIEISIPAAALVDIKIRSLRDESTQDSGTPAKVGNRNQSSLLLKPGSVTGPRFVLHSIRGTVQVQRP